MRVCLAVLLFVALEAGASTRVLVPLEKRVRSADLIVIGRLRDVVWDRFSITYYDYWMSPVEVEAFGERDLEMFYALGSIEVERRLKGTHEQTPISFAFYSRAETNGRTTIMTGMDGMTFRENDHGIWLLNQSEFLAFGYFGVNDPDNFVSIDKLDDVEAILRRGSGVVDDPSN